jgi:ubiquinol-cytochrome c reductase cytochrome b subunit
MPVDRRRARQSVSDRASARLRNLTVFGHRVEDLEIELGRRAVPNHWTTLFGVVTVACVVTVTGTGFLLMFFYTPSSDSTTYTGTYAALHGVEVTKAFASMMRITFEVPGGLLVRQLHHWSALLLPASILIQILITFFTGAFRRPRRMMWVLLFAIYVVSLVGGWSGYALPDDLLSSTGLRITEGIILAIPVVGTWLSFLFFGGSFPGQVIEHLYPIHVAVVPVLLIVLMVMRGAAGWHHKPPQFPGVGRTHQNVVGIPLVPTAAARAGGLGLIVVGLLVVLSATVTVNPIWLYGPASPGEASAGSQPDWYTGFFDGALRLVPPGWEFVWLNHTWTVALLLPLAVVTVYLMAIPAYPFVEEWITGDRREHHLLDRPRNTAVRTGIGVSAIVFYAVLWVAGSADLIAVHFSLTLEFVILVLQVALFTGPIVAFMLAHRVCLALQRKDREILLHGFETGRIVRLPGGEYTEIHGAVDSSVRWRLSPTENYRPRELAPDDRGKVSVVQRLRVGLSRFFFEDRIDAPVTEPIAMGVAPTEPAENTGTASVTR